MTIRPFTGADVPAMTAIWNDVVKADNAFPQSDPMGPREANAFFHSQSLTAVAEDQGEIVGLYILHPNGIGHLGKNANASYAVRADKRGTHIGEALVTDSLLQAKALGFHNLQFNAVLASNAPALHLYAKLGFRSIGILKDGYLHDDGTWEDLRLFSHPL
ncbi:MAG: GNAT family N-acetyltransferase [Sphaerochaeta sp.]|jgi:L-amino acid N-acyltransferase YncA|nr:GNAT family N-acetyltransferase [Sphaerochaeta sp.]